MSFNSAWIRPFRFRITLASMIQRLKCSAPFIYHLTEANKQTNKNTVRLAKWPHRREQEKKNIKWRWTLCVHIFLLLWNKWAQNRNIYYHFSVKKWFLQFSNAVRFFFSPLLLLFQYSFFMVSVFFYFIHFTFDQRPKTHIVVSAFVNKSFIKKKRQGRTIVHSNNAIQNEVKGWSQHQTGGDSSTCILDKFDLVLLLLLLLLLMWFFFLLLLFRRFFNLCKMCVVQKIHWELL